MKFDIKDAYVASITPIGEHHGEEVVLAKAVKIEATVTPRQMDAITPAIRKQLFADDIPSIPGIGTIHWKLEYEKARVTLVAAVAEGDEEGDPLVFTKADIKKITFAPREGFIFDLGFLVKVTPDEAQAGALDFMLKRTVHLVIEKATQKTVEEAEEEDDEAPPQSDAQPGLPHIQPLLKPADLQAVNEVGDPTATAALAAIEASEGAERA